jgi:hypothetical protein
MNAGMPMSMPSYKYEGISMVRRTEDAVHLHSWSKGSDCNTVDHVSFSRSSLWKIRLSKIQKRGGAEVSSAAVWWDDTAWEALLTYIHTNLYGNKDTKKRDRKLPLPDSGSRICLPLSRQKFPSMFPVATRFFPLPCNFVFTALQAVYVPDWTDRGRGVRSVISRIIGFLFLIFFENATRWTLKISAPDSAIVGVIFV